MFKRFRKGSAPSNEDNDKVSELVEMGFARMRSEDAEGALDFAEKALLINPRHVTAMLLKGSACGVLGRSQESIVCFERVLQQDPQAELAWWGKGMCLLQSGRPEEALGYFEKAHALGHPGSDEMSAECRRVIAAKKNSRQSDNPELKQLLGRGRRLVREFRWQEALACGEQAVKLDSKSETAWTLKGIALGGLGRGNEAHAAFDKAIALNPQSVDAWFEKAIQHREDGENEKALACYDMIISFHPNDAGTWFNKGAVLLVGLGRHEEALACYEKAERLGMNEATPVIAKCKEMIRDKGKGNMYGDQSRIWYDKGTKLLEAGQVEEAIDYLNRAVKMSPQYAHAWQALGYAEQRRDRPDVALTYFDRVLQIDPLFGNAWKEKGVSLAALNRTDEAFECLDRALELEPDDTNGWINKGILLLNLERVHEARPCFEKAKELGHPRADQYLAKCDDVVEYGSALTPAQRNFQVAYQEFKNARSFDDMKAAAARYRWMATPIFVKEVRENLQRREADFSKGAYDARLRWLEAVPPDPMHLALEAFNETSSLEDMKSAVAEFPFMTDPEYLNQLELLLANQLSEESDKGSAFRERLIWLRKIGTPKRSALLNDEHTALVEEAVELLSAAVAEAESSDFTLNQDRVNRFKNNMSFLDDVLREVKRSPLVHEMLQTAVTAYQVGFTTLVALYNRDPEIARQADEAAYGRFKPWADEPELVEQAIRSNNEATIWSLWDFLLSATRDFAEQTITLMNLDWQPVPEEDYDAQTWVERALYYRDQGDLDQAISCAQSAIETDPTNVGAYAILGTLQMDNGDKEAGAENLKTAIRLDPDYLLTYWNLHHCLWQMGQHDESIRTLEQLAARLPDTENVMVFQDIPLHMIYSKIGWQYDVLGRQNAAEKAYAIAHRLDRE